MPTSTLLISFSDHHTSWQRNALLLNRLNGQHCAISSVSIVSSAPPIELSIFDNWLARSKIFIPSREWRLFVKVAVEQKSLIDSARNLSEDKRGISLIFDDLAPEPRNSNTNNPFLKMLGSLSQQPIGLPFNIIGSGGIGDLNILHEGRQSIQLKLLMDEVLTRIRIEAIHAFQMIIHNLIGGRVQFQGRPFLKCRHIIFQSKAMNGIMKSEYEDHNYKGQVSQAQWELVVADLHKFSTGIGGTVIDAPPGIKKYRVLIDCGAAIKTQAHLQYKPKKDLLLASFDFDLQAHWPHIIQAGISKLQDIVNRWNANNNMCNVLCLKTSVKALQAKMTFAILQNEINFVDLLRKNWVELAQGMLFSLKGLKSDQSSQILNEIYRTKKFLEKTRRQRYKSTPINLLGKYSGGDLIEDLAVNQVKALQKDRQRLNKQYKAKMQKSQPVFACIEQKQSQLITDWTNNHGSQGILQKYRVSYFLHLLKSVDKITNALIQREEQIDEQIKTIYQDSKKLRTSTFVRKSSRQGSASGGSFDLEKHMLAFMRMDKCLSINNYYCSEGYGVATMTSFYSDFHEKTIGIRGLKPKPMMKILQTLLEGLVHFFNREIIHRDLKPDNVLLSRQYVCKIIDFGSSCHCKLNRSAIWETVSIISNPSPLQTNVAYNTPYSRLNQFLKDTFTRKEYETHCRFDMQAYGRIIHNFISQSSIRYSIGELLWDNLYQLGAMCDEPNPDDRPCAIDAYFLFTRLARCLLQ